MRGNRYRPDMCHWLSAGGHITLCSWCDSGSFSRCRRIPPVLCLPFCRYCFRTGTDCYLAAQNKSQTGGDSGKAEKIGRTAQRRGAITMRKKLSDMTKQYSSFFLCVILCCLAAEFIGPIKLSLGRFTVTFLPLLYAMLLMLVLYLAKPVRGVGKAYVPAASRMLSMGVVFAVMGLCCVRPPS